MLQYFLTMKCLITEIKIKISRYEFLEQTDIQSTFSVYFSKTDSFQNLKFSSKNKNIGESNFGQFSFIQCLT